MLDFLYDEAMELKVVGIIKPKEDVDSAMLSGSIAYTSALTEYIIEEALNSEVVKAQLANPDYDILTGLPFKSAAGNMTDEEKKAEFLTYVNALNAEGKSRVYLEMLYLKNLDLQLEGRVNMIMNMMPQDKDTLIDAVIQSMNRSEGSSVSADTIRRYLEKLTVDELKAMIRPEIEKSQMEAIRTQLENSYAYDADAMQAMLDTADLATFVRYYDEITQFSDSTYEDILISSVLGAVVALAGLPLFFDSAISTP